ncbi:MAG: hypothetical protein HYY88_05090 [candidate division NC10 bacterium]|nr:hypothetical protein [candidate division NC10 bacterium]
MKRAVRNRLADLLLQAFDDPDKRAAIAWLALFCELTFHSDRPQSTGVLRFLDWMEASKRHLTI